MMVPFVCIMTQPDLGTGLVYLCIAAFALVMGGANTKYLLITLGLLAWPAVVAVFAVDERASTEVRRHVASTSCSSNYQRNRLLVFLDQSGTATTDEGYNLAAGEGRHRLGRPVRQGLVPGHATHSTRGLLPEAPTDFIFCVLAEELGFLGVARAARPVRRARS